MTRRVSAFPLYAALMLTLTWPLCAASAAAEGEDAAPQRAAREILRHSGVRGGLIVHLGCRDGRLTAALLAGDGWLVQGLDTDAKNVHRARRHLQSLGIYGKTSVDRFDGQRLPYVDNLVNLVVAEDGNTVPMREVMRVLCPEGVAMVNDHGRWTKTVKPRPPQIDDWSHYLHDASNNAVAHDSVVGPPRRLQWVGSPKWARHHDRMSSVSAVVSAGGRVFYIFDEAPRVSILMPPRWKLIARDAFNGTILWKRPIDRWHTHLWPLKSGPAQLPRRLVTDGERVYVTLSLDGPLTALDAATGRTVRTYQGTQAVEEVILSDGVLFALVNDAAEKPDYDGSRRFGKAYGAKFWDEAARKIKALRADTGELLWTAQRSVLPATLAADARRVVFHDGQSVVCLRRDTGGQLWRSDPIQRSKEIRSFYLPTLVLYEDVVLFSGGETAGLQTGSWYTSGKDTLTALSADKGQVLWTAYHPPSGYRSPEDLLVAGGLVWTGETTSGRAVGVFTGRDPKTGEVKSQFAPDVDVYWFHHRCYRGKATDDYLLMARAGTEFVDVDRKHWIPHHWFRGACLYGVMPANGLIYAPQHPCACYLEAKLEGFNALAAASAGPRVPDYAKQVARLEEGPAFDRGSTGLSPSGTQPSEDWPTYRHDAARSGRAATSVPTELATAWRTDLLPPAAAGRLSSPVVAAGKVFVASVDAHTVYGLDAASGRQLWQFTAGGRVDSPPTIYKGRVLFGSADGWVYCLRDSDGVLAWRFRAAPMDQRLTSREQVESVWPVHGSVLVQDGVVYCVAGRSMFLDGGLRMLRLDPLSGRLLSETVMDDTDPDTGKDLHTHVSWLNMPVGLPDVLSSDGKLVYMRSQPFRLDGTRLPLEPLPAGRDADAGAPPPTQRAEHAHLFSPTGFLDDAWWHRSYWLWGSRFVSGWCGYFLAGRAAPAGKILAVDDTKVYGFGRKPQYYRWTTQIEHHLFAAAKTATSPDASAGSTAGGSRVRVEKSESLNPAGKPLTVEAWVKAEGPHGVVLARGGGAMGYTLYLQGGRPRFAVRTDGDTLRAVAAKQKVVGRWVHLTGVLTPQKDVKIYVDGRPAAAAKIPELIAADPQEALEIGADEGSVVGGYNGPLGLTGLIDEVRLYRRALDDEQIKMHAAGATGATAADARDTDLVLSLSFDGPKAADASGNDNHGRIEGAVSAEGKIGKALKFTAGPTRPAGFEVRHHWTKDVPLFARAMVLADGVLLIAGPADVVDEEQALRQINEPQTGQALARQAAAFEGRKGAVLWAVSAADGRRLAQHKLDAPPVFDGMAAADGRLYMVTTTGRVYCLAGQ